jgi:hypothetical protein
MNGITLDCPSWNDGRGLIVVQINNTYFIYHESLETSFPTRLYKLKHAKDFLEMFYRRFPQIDWKEDCQMLHDKWHDTLVEFGEKGLNELAEKSKS